MKILFIPYGTEKAPATRYRVMQYLPMLKQKGVDYKIFSAISKLSTELMIKSPDFHPLTRFLYYMYVFSERFFRFFAILYTASKFDTIFLQRTTFPLRLEILLKVVNNNIIFDIDDAIYMPDREGKDIITRLKKFIKMREVINILGVSRTVVVENDYIKNFVSKCCKNVVKIPGPIDTARFYVKPKEKRKEVIIGWIGSPATTSYLRMMDNVFTVISEKYNFVKLKFIGLGKYAPPGITYDKVAWSYDTEVKDLQDCDIGIMPMPDNEWTRGKLGCKMLQYMALGIPSVVSFTPTNAEIIKDGENGFFARDEKSWVEIISKLIENKDLREKVGQKARETILDKCALSHNVERLIDIFKGIS